MPGLMATREEYGPGAAAARRPHRRLAAHDHPDRGADRDADAPRRRCALGFLQHLFDAGPRRRGDRASRRAGVRGQGREPGRLLGLHPPHLRMVGRRLPEHDPRRRRRRHAAFAPRPAGGEQCGGAQSSRQRGRGSAVRRHQEADQGSARLVHQARQGSARRHRGNHHRRAPALSDGQGRPPAVPGDQRQRQRHQIEIRQPVRLPRVAGRRHPPRHRRDDGRQGGDGRRLRRCRQRLGRLAAPGRLPRDGVRSRSDLRAAGGDGRLRSRHHGRRRRAPTSSAPPPAMST